MKITKVFTPAAALWLGCLVAVDPPGLTAQAGGAQSTVVDQLLDQVVERERRLMETLSKRAPLIETYIQELGGGRNGESPGRPERLDHSNEDHPTKDHYFLGRFRLAGEIVYEPLIRRTDDPPQKAAWIPSHFASLKSQAFGTHALGTQGVKAQALSFLPRGFAQMAVIDLHDFNRATYTFEYIRREFLGEVRCLVLDVFPANRSLPGKFIGRIWVEDRDFAIVRFNGTYVQRPTPKGGIPERYFHFDSWRVNTETSTWAPAQIYVEEEGTEGLDKTAGKNENGKVNRAGASRDGKNYLRQDQAVTALDNAGASPRFKAQARIWDYTPGPSTRLDELTRMLIESETPIRDEAASKDISPLESQRSWERQAEDNLLGRLEKGGFLAPTGPVEMVLDTVLNNLIVSAKLDGEAHCRVLLTTPLETFSIGHTVVISRGLIDVLPDETSLALVLADELAHIALGHRTPTQFAFTNQTMLSDAELLQRLRFQRPPAELLAAGKKTVEIMRASPYQNTANAGLFLKALEGRMEALPRLLQANLGNQVANADALARLQEFAARAPALEENKLEQIAALPLGSRVKVAPWNNRMELVKTRPISLLSPREKLPFEITPFVLYLTRAEGSEAAATAK